MSKQSAQLANAERVADEAIDLLNRLNEKFRAVVLQANDTYPGSFTDEIGTAEGIDAAVIRLRQELEGQG